MSAFWSGFEKRADGALTGGGGFTGAGKGNLGTAEKDQVNGTVGGNDETKADHTMIDRERGPRSDDPFDLGPEFQDSSNPHLRY